MKGGENIMLAASVLLIAAGLYLYATWAKNEDKKKD